MRRRRSAGAASGISTRKGRISVSLVISLYLPGLVDRWTAGPVGSGLRSRAMAFTPAPGSLPRLSPSNSVYGLVLVIPTRCSVVRRGGPVPVGGQERGQRGQQLLGSLLGNPVAAAGDDQGLHVVGRELHRVPDAFTGAFRSAYRQHGQGQPPDLAVFVLRDAGGDGTVEPEAAAQVVGVGGEGVDVIPDRVAGQLVGPGGSVELGAEEDIFPPGDELLVYRGELVEGKVPEPLVKLWG